MVYIFFFIYTHIYNTTYIYTHIINTVNIDNIANKIPIEANTSLWCMRQREREKEREKYREKDGEKGWNAENEVARRTGEVRRATKVQRSSKVRAMPLTH